MSSMRLPQFIAIKSHEFPGLGYAYSDDKEPPPAGGIRVGEESVFSPLTKIEIERAASNERYVNLRFCHTNRYWVAYGVFLYADFTKAHEDTSSPHCTMFEPIKVNDNGVFYLTHVHTGHRLVVHGYNEGRCLISDDPRNDEGYLTFVNYDELVKLPRNVTFKGDNGHYLKAYYNGYPYVQFQSLDPNDHLSGHQINLMPDGHLRIYTNHFGMFWRRSPDWIWADSSDTTAGNPNTLFWPCIVNNKNNTIALRNAGNNHFCKRLSVDGKTDCLNAADGSITDLSTLQVVERVSERKIYSVRYRMEHARVFDEQPYLAGTTAAENRGDEEESVSVAITYEDERSYSFTRSVSLTAGVTTKIEAGVLGIEEASIEIKFEITGTMEWGQTETKKTGVTATATVPVPPRSSVRVEYVGTRGKCNVPFTYMQEDKSSVDGTVTVTEQIDGVYNGVNCYNFNFVTQKPVPV